MGATAAYGRDSGRAVKSAQGDALFAYKLVEDKPALLLARSPTHGGHGHGWQAGP